jgi:hypothetical protein
VSQTREATEGLEEFDVGQAADELRRLRVPGRLPDEQMAQTATGRDQIEKVILSLHLVQLLRRQRAIPVEIESVEEGADEEILAFNGDKANRK